MFSTNWNFGSTCPCIGLLLSNVKWLSCSDASIKVSVTVASEILWPTQFSLVYGGGDLEEEDAKQKDQAVGFIQGSRDGIQAIGVEQGPVAEGVLGGLPDGSPPSTPVVAVTVDTAPPDAVQVYDRFDVRQTVGDEGWDVPRDEEVDYDAHTPLSV